MAVTVVGDAMARPLAAAIERGTLRPVSLALVANGGALLTPTAKQRLIDAVPGLIVVDGVGSSETGAQMTHMSAPGAVSTGTFSPARTPVVASRGSRAGARARSRRHRLAGAARASAARLHGRRDQDGATFPVIDGVRYRCRATGRVTSRTASVELLGRDSVTINSGGEKIFAEEVELALASHPAVADVVVVGRPSERWGQEVVAVVALADGAGADAEDVDRPRRNVFGPLQAAQGRRVPTGDRAQPGR